MTVMFDELEVPKFSLLDKIDFDSMHQKYALYLFMALFTIRGRLVNWFIQRPKCIELLTELDDSTFIEISHTINSFLVLFECQIDQCIEWAFVVWFRVFVINVEVANTELSKLGRENRHKANIKEMYKLNIDFISSAAEILATMIGLEVDTENIILRSKSYYDQHYLKEVPARQHKKFIKFVDLSSDLKNANILQSKEEFSKLPVHVKCMTVAEPSSKNLAIEKFLTSVIKIRYFNFTKSLKVNSSLLINLNKQKIPVFPMSNLFMNIY